MTEVPVFEVRADVRLQFAGDITQARRKWRYIGGGAERESGRVAGRGVGVLAHDDDAHPVQGLPESTQNSGRRGQDLVTLCELNFELAPNLVQGGAVWFEHRNPRGVDELEGIGAVLALHFAPQSLAGGTDHPIMTRM